MLNSKFILGQNLEVFMFDIYIQLVIVFLLSSTENGKKSVMGTSFMQPLLLIICLIWILFRELKQLRTTYARLYMNETTSWIDIVQIVLLFWIATGLCESRKVYACAIISSWFALIFGFSDLHYQLSVFVTSADKVCVTCVVMDYNIQLLTLSVLCCLSDKRIPL